MAALDDSRPLWPSFRGAPEPSAAASAEKLMQARAISADALGVLRALLTPLEAAHASLPLSALTAALKLLPTFDPAHARRFADELLFDVANPNHYQWLAPAIAKLFTPAALGPLIVAALRSDVPLRSFNALWLPTFVGSRAYVLPVEVAAAAARPALRLREPESQHRQFADDHLHAARHGGRKASDHRICGVRFSRRESVGRE